MNGLALCSGYDGFGLGLGLIFRDYRTVCHVEREAYAAAILAARMEDKTLAQAPIWDDLITFDGKPWRGKVDIITAGFPCQPWSYAGKRKGKEDERWIWPDIARIIGEILPEIVFLENVPGLLVGGLDDVLGTLASFGYNAEWSCFCADEVGSPQKRERVFILAYLYRYGFQIIWKHELQQNVDPSLWDHADRCHKDLGDSNGNRCHEGDGSTITASKALPKLGFSSIFPPERDPKAWLRVPAEDQPALSRMADGDPTWVDQCRASGNGVIPGVAALAFIELASRIEEN